MPHRLFSNEAKKLGIALGNAFASVEVRKPNVSISVVLCYPEGHPSNAVPSSLKITIRLRPPKDVSLEGFADTVRYWMGQEMAKKLIFHYAGNCRMKNVHVCDPVLQTDNASGLVCVVESRRK